jgi:hypothetical protein
MTTDKQLIRRIQNTISLWKNGLVDPDDAIKLTGQAAGHRRGQEADAYRGERRRLGHLRRTPRHPRVRSRAYPFSQFSIFSPG